MTTNLWRLLTALVEVAKIMFRSKNKNQEKHWQWLYQENKFEMLLTHYQAIQGERLYKTLIWVNEYRLLQITNILPCINIVMQNFVEKKYRVIHFLSSLSKLFETLLHKRIINFCQKKLLRSSQYDFWSKKLWNDSVISLNSCKNKKIRNHQAKPLSLIFPKISTLYIKYC